ncbi:MAG TPA: hypothetical protein VE860_26225, partial [Chthoniobacterales bacterium]|nr:hypothetical protein [Chthoniobacterales bacterium]
MSNTALWRRYLGSLVKRNESSADQDAKLNSIARWTTPLCARILYNSIACCGDLNLEYVDPLSRGATALTRQNISGLKFNANDALSLSPFVSQIWKHNMTNCFRSDSF